MLLIDGYRLDLTCSACPEQYDVYAQDTVVGYLRLRHGVFTASIVEAGQIKNQVFSMHPEGDGLFEPDERLPALKQAIAAIQRHFCNRFFTQADDEEA